jgi:2-polyprenyl-3-methyl-5-hydroxy-6-metoxy-1,4-benzoquinol methylase
VTVEGRYRERYESGDIPWEAGRPDFNLIDVVTRRPVPGCKALDIGCGAGDSSIWLARNHFQVTATDSSPVALQKAKEKASKAGVECDFGLADFFKSKIEAAPFGFIFDRGCFHSFDPEEDRSRFAGNWKVSGGTNAI